MKKLLLCLLLGFPVLHAQATFLPESLIQYGSLSEGPPNLSEQEFRAILNQVQTLYAPVVKKQGGNLAVNGDWKSETLNAGATQMFGTWRVEISGALARRPELTPDGFALILCHELGHHLGGFAFAAGGNPLGGVWAANEGQADYFATQGCARRLWAGEREKNAGFRGKVPPYVQERCDQAWESEGERDLCYRISAGSKSVTDTMAALMKKPAPNFETPDATVVSKTLDSHPPVQCRMDTSFQGAICPVTFDDNFIPGKKSPGGPFGLAAEQEGARNSCTKMSAQPFGHRPACWFKARM